MCCLYTGAKLRSVKFIWEKGLKTQKDPMKWLSFLLHFFHQHWKNWGVCKWWQKKSIEMKNELGAGQCARVWVMLHRVYFDQTSICACMRVSVCICSQWGHTQWMWIGKTTGDKIKQILTNHGKQMWTLHRFNGLLELRLGSPRKRCVSITGRWKEREKEMEKNEAKIINYCVPLVTMVNQTSKFIVLVVVLHSAFPFLTMHSISHLKCRGRSHV